MAAVAERAPSPASLTAVMVIWTRVPGTRPVRVYWLSVTVGGDFHRRGIGGGGLFEDAVAVGAASVVPVGKDHAVVAGGEHEVLDGAGLLSAGGTVHLGASLLIFGYLGFLAGLAGALALAGQRRD